MLYVEASRVEAIMSNAIHDFGDTSQFGKEQRSGIGSEMKFMSLRTFYTLVNTTVFIPMSNEQNIILNTWHSTLTKVAKDI